jgi:imidazolonepropionase-like amidohydrolase
MRRTNPYLRLLTASFSFFLWNVTIAQSPAVYALTGVTIIDAANEKPLANETIIVKGQTIPDVFPTGSKKLADTIMIFSLKGKYILPGLIDTHVHLATDPSGSDSASTTKKALEKMLYSGITSVRDMAGDARILAGLSRNALVGEIPSPNIYYSAFMAGPEFFKADERTVTSTRGGISGKMPYMQAMTDSTNMVIAVAQAKGTGAKGIKLYASLSGRVVEKVVAEAKKQDMLVWAHATLFPAKPFDVVLSGVNVISHADMLIFTTVGSIDSIPPTWKKKQSKEFWDKAADNVQLDGLFDLMRKKNTILDATLAANYNLVRQHPQVPILESRYEMAKRLTAKAYNAGVKICTGTDTDQKLLVQEEMKLLVHECRFTPFDAIVAATKNGAEAIGILDSHGTIEPGKAADLLVLNRNPLDDIKNIDSVNLVIKGGRMYKK